MRKVIFFILSLIYFQGQSQTIDNRPIESDSTLTTFQLVQKEIKTKDIGTFNYSYNFDDGNIHSKVSIQNFYSKKDSGAIWTIVSKYDFDKSGQLTNKSFWKTDNISKACECNVWYKKAGKITAITIYHPRCKKIKLNCDSNGKHATK